MRGLKGLPELVDRQNLGSRPVANGGCAPAIARGAYLVRAARDPKPGEKVPFRMSYEPVTIAKESHSADQTVPSSPSRIAHAGAWSVTELTIH